MTDIRALPEIDEIDLLSLEHQMKEARKQYHLALGKLLAKAFEEGEIEEMLAILKARRGGDSESL